MHPSLKHAAESLRKQLHDIEQTKPSCGNCEHLAGFVCVKVNDTPPDNWLLGVVDCEHWKFDFIPF